MLPLFVYGVAVILAVAFPKEKVTSLSRANPHDVGLLPHT